MVSLMQRRLAMLKASPIQFTDVMAQLAEVLALNASLAEANSDAIGADFNASLGHITEITNLPAAATQAVVPIELDHDTGLSIYMIAPVSATMDFELGLDGMAATAHSNRLTVMPIHANLGLNVALNAAQFCPISASLDCHLDTEVTVDATIPVFVSGQVDAVLGTSVQVVLPEPLMLTGSTHGELALNANAEFDSAAPMAAAIEAALAIEATGEGAELPWIDPVQTGDSLFIPQAYEVLQTGTSLKIS